MEHKVYAAVMQEKSDGSTMLRGIVMTDLPDDAQLYAKIDGKQSPVKLIRGQKMGADGMEDCCFFSLSVNFEELSFVIKDGGEMRPVKIIYGPWSRLAPGVNETYCSRRYIYQAIGNDALTRQGANWQKRFLAHGKYWGSLIVRMRWKEIAFRLIVKIRSIFRHNTIWLISDRRDAANDNGFALFKYMVDEHPDVKAFFVIDKAVADFGKYGPRSRWVVLGSFRHRLLYALADCVMSSQLEVAEFNPLWEKVSCRDISSKPFVFLQHGVIKDNLSTYCNGYEKRVDLFITTGSAERDSIVGEEYGYGANQVALTGLPRFDLLTNKKHKVVLLAPTWRSYIAKESEKNKTTTYYKFYMRLLQDRRLMAALEENHYKIIFAPHPNMSSLLREAVEFGEKVEAIWNNADYGQLFAEASFLVTDYSSIAFDMAYLRKPTIYAQFDREEVFSRHTTKLGYFDYERHGFGPVAESYQETLEAIIAYIRKDGEMEKKYRDRANAFFKYSDRKNCQRVYEAILNLDRYVV